MQDPVVPVCAVIPQFKCLENLSMKYLVTFEEFARFVLSMTHISPGVQSWTNALIKARGDPQVFEVKARTKRHYKSEKKKRCEQKHRY